MLNDKITRVYDLYPVCKPIRLFQFTNMVGVDVIKDESDIFSFQLAPKFDFSFGNFHPT